eukprot:1156678-Pelagomonas_calceolata.AAC.2
MAGAGPVSPHQGFHALIMPAARTFLNCFTPARPRRSQCRPKACCHRIDLDLKAGLLHGIIISDHSAKAGAEHSTCCRGIASGWPVPWQLLPRQVQSTQPAAEAELQAGLLHGSFVRGHCTIAGAGHKACCQGAALEADESG